MEASHRTAELIERDAWLDIFAAASDHVRESLGIASDSIEGMGLLGCRAIPITELNRAMAVGVEVSPSRDDLRGVTDWLDAHAAGWALQVPPDAEAPAARDYLAEAGLVETGAGWAKFVGVEVSPAPLPADAAFKIEAVGGQGAELFGRVVTEGFGLPAVCGEWFGALAGRPSWQCFVATIEGEFAGGGAIFVRDGAAWLGVEATVPAYRGRGLQGGIVAAQLRAAAEAGAPVLTAETARPVNRDDAGFSSYRNQERAGLTHAYTRPNFKRAD